MLNSGKKFRALLDKKINILTLVLSEIFVLNETKNHKWLNGRSLRQVCFSVTQQKNGADCFSLISITRIG